MTGTLYGIGLGPGDPELMTLKAHRLITSARVVAYPALEGGESLARSIAAAVIPQDAEELVISVPMTTARGPAQAAYDKAAAAIAGRLEAGRDVLVLCEGDPLFYGSFMFLLARLSRRFACEVVPGVSSLTACAAVLRQPLAARNETLTVLPGPLPEAELRARLEAAEAVVIMKVGRHLAKIRRVLDGLGLSAQAQYVERATLPNQKVMPLADAPDDAPYFSMILISKGGDPWLS